VAGDDATEAAATPDQAGSSTRRAEQESDPRHWISERHQGHFQRSFTFPIAVDFNRVKARLADGLLRIMAPKSTEQEAIVQRIPVEG
jgi:HSP20 family protein